MVQWWQLVAIMAWAQMIQWVHSKVRYMGTSQLSYHQHSGTNHQIPLTTLWPLFWLWTHYYTEGGGKYYDCSYTQNLMKQPLSKALCALTQQSFPGRDLHQWRLVFLTYNLPGLSYPKKTTCFNIRQAGRTYTKNTMLLHTTEVLSLAKSRIILSSLTAKFIK